MKKNLALISLLLFLTGCLSTSQILEMGRDTYSVTATADGYRLASEARESAFKAGEKKCSSLGKRFMFTNESTTRTRMDIDTTVTVIFRCLNESDPEYTRPIIKKSPNVVIEDKRN